VFKKSSIQDSETSICLELNKWEGADDVKIYRIAPLASEAKMPPEQSAAKIMNDVFILCWKSG
jgi:hypothetical protein